MTKRMIDIILVMIVLTVIGPLIYRGYQNYNGYCRAEKRYLSDEEKIHSMIKFINYMDKIPIETKDQGTQLYKQIPYKNVGDFIKLNPNCCYFGYENVGDGNTLRAAFFDKVIGYHSATGHVNFTLRYLDKNNKEKRKDIEWHFIVGNCARINRFHP